MASCLLAVSVLASVNPDAPLDRYRTLLRPGWAHSLVQEFDRQTRDTSAALLHVFPRPCHSDLDGTDACPGAGGMTWVDSIHDGLLRLHPVIGLENRELHGESVLAGEGGAHIEGGVGPASFYLDARIFSETQSASLPTYDGEYVEHQRAGESSHFDYASYSRYRARVSLETPIGRFASGRETQNWGPSALHALVLSQDATPYSHLDWTVELGPFTVRSLVADLSIPGPGESKTIGDTRTLFAHRYEWRATRNVTLGISEALILYNRDAPECFLPVVPLFMQKGLWFDNINNGELAVDGDWRAMQGWRLYGEFFMDDMTSPTTLFNSQWKSKWAITLGSQISFPQWNEISSGIIIEWSRIEPWVYTHYAANTSQALNGGILLGGGLGPNSQEATMQLYGSKGKWGLSLRGDLVWKGTDLGSQADDTLHDNEETRKIFLHGQWVPGFRIEPELSWAHNWLSLSIGSCWQWNTNVWNRIPVVRDEPTLMARIAIEY